MELHWFVLPVEATRLTAVLLFMTILITNMPITTTQLTMVVYTTKFQCQNKSTLLSQCCFCPDNQLCEKTTVLQCKNGGNATNEYCICPDDYTGRFCETPNYCNKTTVHDFTFPKTTVGQAGYSTQTCPPGNINAGFPLATAWCHNETRTFDGLRKLNCSLILKDIFNKLKHADNETLQILASNTQILTSKPHSLSPQNISDTVQLVNSLLSNSDHNQDVLSSTLTTISQLLNASVEQFPRTVTDDITSLTKTLWKLSLNLSATGPSLIQPNIAIQSFKSSNTSKIQLTTFSGFSDIFSSNRIMIDDGFHLPGQQAYVDVQMNIKLKNELEEIHVGFVLYNNDHFFVSKLFEPSLGIKRKVISGQLKEGVLDFVNFTMGIPKPFHRSAHTKTQSNLHLRDFSCVLWDYEDKQDWSTRNCEKASSPVQPSCTCTGITQLANFAVLMSFSSSPEYSLPLGLISIIGSALSVVCLTITIIFQILTRKSRKSSPTVLLVSLCVCMTIVYLLFIFGINNSPPSFSFVPSEENTILHSDLHQDPDRGPCTAFTSLLHYFLLAAFTWSTLYALHIFLLIKNYTRGPPEYCKVLTIIVGWGLPAVVVGISMGITYRIENPLNYRQETLCWLAVKDQDKKFDVMKPMLWGFLLPVAVMLLFNIAVVFVFTFTTCRTNPNLNSSQVRTLKSKMLGCMSLVVVLGLSWVIGYFLLLEKNPIKYNILSFAFCLTNTTQGIQIFVLFTLRTPFMKKKIRSALNCCWSSDQTVNSSSRS